MPRDNLDFETITKALQQSYEVIWTEEKPSQMAIQKLQEARELLNEAIMYTLEKDRPAI